MKVLISFIAFSHDFFQNVETGELEINKEGTTYSFYRDLFFKENYDKHFLLIASPREENRCRQNILIEGLITSFPKAKEKIERKELMIRDIINHKEITSELRSFLISMESQNISRADLFISPGTPAMQTAWILSHINPHIKLNTRLVQTKKPNKGEKTVLQEVDFELGGVPENVTRRTQFVQREVNLQNDDFLLLPSLEEVYSKVRMVAESKDVTTLINGATGSGKENLARSIHTFSPRKEYNFAAINCAALNDELLESRLFGHKKGAFTGAIDNHKGIFEQCDGGTIFLDEIGDISPKLQQTLLRVLQEKVITPIGGKDKKVDVRVVSATHQDLAQKCEEGSFRWDLYYRLAVVELELPTLFDMPLDDRKLLLKHFLKSKQRYFKRKKVMKLSPAVEKLLLEYSYPGNIREMENLIMGLYVFNKENEEVRVEDLPKRLTKRKVQEDLAVKQDFVLHQHYHKIYKICNNNKAKAYQKIGVSQNTFEKYFNMDFGNPTS